MGKFMDNMKRFWWIGLAAILAVVAAATYWYSGEEDNAALYATVKKGDFKVAVNVSGELDAKNSLRVLGPGGLGDMGIWQVKINKIINEGTRIQKGDFVAELDKSELFNKLRDRQNELVKAQSQFTQTRLDTALNLREARDKLINLGFAVEEKKIVLEQSVYEPPATIKQARIDLEKATRDYQQAKENYKVKVEQAQAKMAEVASNLQKEQNALQAINDMITKMDIVAPEDGMLIYHRDWSGRKLKTGSTINTWSPVVATLPDLSKMVSRTYVNEIDIRKVKAGQKVEIGLDAFPDKKLTGEVTTVANIGEQKPNSDAKVFEVEILIHQQDTSLRPSMTTGNLIVGEVLKNVLYLPLESLHAQGDSLTFVYKKDGLNVVKQEVLVGATNENEAVILAGLDESEVVLLSVPEGLEKQAPRLLPEAQRPKAKKAGSVAAHNPAPTAQKPKS